MRQAGFVSDVGRLSPFLQLRTECGLHPTRGRSLSRGAGGVFICPRLVPAEGLELRFS